MEQRADLVRQDLDGIRSDYDLPVPRDVDRHPVLQRPRRRPADPGYLDDGPRFSGNPAYAGLPDPDLAARHAIIDVRHAHLQDKAEEPGLLAPRQPPHHQERHHRWDGKDHQKNGRFISNCVPRLGDSDPHIDARTNQPERDEDLGRGDKGRLGWRASDQSPDQKT